MYLRMCNFTYVALLLFSFIWGSTADDPGCLSVGACLSSEGSYVDRVAADSIHDCRQKCQLEYNRGCRYFTYFPKDTYACTMYGSCVDLDDYCAVLLCFSGSVYCDDPPCYFEGSSCEDDALATLVEVESSDACLDECRSTDGCGFATYNGYTRICVLTETCRERDPCGDCVVAAVRNDSCDDKKR